MPRLAFVLRKHAGVDAHHLYGTRVVVTLPSSGDIVNLTPVGNNTLRWDHKTAGDTPVESGELLWEKDPDGILRWVINRAYSLGQIVPQYAGVMAELSGRGLSAELVDADGGGFLIRIDLPDHTFLLIGGGGNLPPRADQVERWHVQHEGVEDHIAVVFRSPNSGTADAAEMAEAAASYVRLAVASPRE
ncbi:hypothetical protein HOK021_16680 [Streptomyces hygroscopicus]|nr:hypothetical protein HOK021_16680 [Streptomyces hygroscopicus]